MDEPNQANQDEPIFDSLSQEPSKDENPVDQGTSESHEAAEYPVDLSEVSDTSEDFDLEEFQASRTQTIMKADLMAVEDDDEGSLAAEYSEDAPVPESPPGRAHECLEIRTPLEEFDTYVRARIDTLTRLGENERVDLTIQALELGKRRLSRITGAQTS